MFKNKVSGIFLILFLTSMAVYLYTLCPGVYWWDSGEFITAAYRLGIPHSTGFPFYVLLSSVFSVFAPLRTIALRINFLSCLSGSLILVYTFLIFLLFTKKENYCFTQLLSGFIGSLSLAFSLIFWSQSVMAGVYIPNLLFLLGAGYHLLYYEQFPENNERHLYFSAFLLGLGLAIHEEMILLIPGIGILLLFSSLRKTLTTQKIFFLISLIFLGCMTYLYIPLRAATHPVLNWDDPQTWHRFKIYITHQDFKEKMFSHSWYGMEILAVAAGREFLNNFTWPGIILGVIGCIYLSRKRFLYFAFSASIILANILLGLVYGHSQRMEQEFSNYFLPGYALFSIWIGIGIYWIFCKVVEIMQKQKSPFLPSIYIVLCLVFVNFPYHLFKQNYQDIAVLKYDLPRQFGHQILQDIPFGSTIYVQNVFTDFITLYLQQVEGVRPDIKIICVNREKHIPRNANDWKQVLETGKPVYAEYDVILSDNLQDYFLPAVYFGRLTSHPVTDRELHDLADQSVYWNILTKSLDIPITQNQPIIIDPHQPFALAKHNLSMLYARRNIWDQAFNESYSSSQYEPNYSEPYLTRGIWYLFQNHIPDAKKELERYVYLNPLSQSGWLNLGTAYAKTGDMDKAIEYFSQAIRINPKSVEGYTNLGLAYVNQQNYSKAESAFRNALQWNSHNPNSWVNLARILSLLGKEQESLTAWQKVLQLDPANTEAKEKLGKQ